jgi:hypothetical protein
MPHIPQLLTPFVRPHPQVWTQFEEKGGFEFGLAHSVVDAFLYLLQETHHWLSLVMPASALWAIVPVANSDEVHEQRAMRVSCCVRIVLERDFTVAFL